MRVRRQTGSGDAVEAARQGPLGPHAASEYGPLGGQALMAGRSPRTWRPPAVGSFPARSRRLHGYRETPVPTSRSSWSRPVAAPRCPALLIRGAGSDCRQDLARRGYQPAPKIARTGHHWGTKVSAGSRWFCCYRYRTAAGSSDPATALSRPACGWRSFSCRQGRRHRPFGIPLMSKPADMTIAVSRTRGAGFRGGSPRECCPGARRWPGRPRRGRHP